MCGNSARDSHTHTNTDRDTHILSARKYTYAHYVIAEQIYFDICVSLSASKGLKLSMQMAT